MASPGQPSPAAADDRPSAASPRRGPWLPTHRRRRWLFLLCYLLFCYLLAWTGIHAFWYLAAAVPFHQRPTLGDQFFPAIRLQGLRDHTPRHTDDSFDLLLLGGSVIHREWGTVEAELRARLEQARPGKFRIYNLSQPGFTSRDSLLNYRQLDQCEFDLVLVYDGINDVRLNCCPPELFRDDYTHNARYGGLARRLEAGQISLPAAALSNLQTAWEGMPLGSADPRLANLATDPGSPRALRANLSELSDLARARGDRLLLMSYAWHIPADYTADRFAEGQLDYHTPAPRACGVEMWGRPELVALAMRRQNAAVAELAAGLPDVLWVDQDAQLPHDREHFIDPCHLTPQGCERFVQNLWPVVEPVVDQFARLP